MKILIDIPKEFEVDYNSNRFAEFFQRCLADMGTCCGNYEKETAEMMEKTFAESRPYDPYKAVEQLEKEIEWYDTHGCNNDLNRGIIGATRKAIEIVKAGGEDV